MFDSPIFKKDLLGVEIPLFLGEGVKGQRILLSSLKTVDGKLDENTISCTERGSHTLRAQFIVPSEGWQTRSAAKECALEIQLAGTDLFDLR